MRLKRSVVAVFVFLAMFIIALPASAQDRSGNVLKQLERKTVLPRANPGETPVITKAAAAKQTAKSAASGKKIFVKTFKVEGATILSQKSINAIIAPYENKELTIAQITHAAGLITAAYREEGYITSNAVIPAQKIKNGIVVIRITEGKTGTVTITGNKHYITEFIRSYIDKIKQDPTFNEQTLERALLLLNDRQSLRVTAALKAGVKPGTTDVIITAKDSYPLSGSLSYDNFGTKTLSKNRAILSINKGNTITEGDEIKLTGITGLDRIDLNKLSYGRIEYTLPVDHSGTRVGVYYANSLYKAGENLTPLDIKGKAHIAGFYITHPLIKKIGTTLYMKLGFNYKDIYDYILDTTRSKDNIRDANLGITYDTTDNLYLSARNILSFTYFRGLGSIFGGTGSNDKNTSRLGADGQYNKFTLTAERIQKLSTYTDLVLKAAGQYSADPLFIAEQFSIGGIGSVRGFDPLAYSGDSGYNITAELDFSPFFSEKTIGKQKVGNTIKFALFADHGEVFRNDRLPGEAKDDSMTSIGTGVRLYYGRNFSAGIDYALPEIAGRFNGRNSKIYLQTTVGF